MFDAGLDLDSVPNSMAIVSEASVAPSLYGESAIMHPVELPFSVFIPEMSVVSFLHRFSRSL
jgi:hypothetical protein